MLYNDMPSPQGQIWILTIKEADWTKPQECNSPVRYIKGQLEEGAGGFRHWQLVVHFARSVRMAAVKRHFAASAHCELTRSAAAESYVWKQDTRIGEPFEIGSRPMQRSREKDWDQIWESAKAGNIDAIPPDVRIRSYANLRRIQSDHMEPQPQERIIFVFCGRTGTGKSKRAWEEAGWHAFPKIPSTKFWDGYRQHEHVVIDEFRGQIGIEHLLRWFDRYPVSVEIKGSCLPLLATKIWVTSNLHPRDWYPSLDEETRDALLRRLRITVFH